MQSQEGQISWSVDTHDDMEVPRADLPMCFTESALEELLRSVGTRPPETGAKGFGPADRMGFDLVEYDEIGSNHASGAVYSPDVEWGTQRVDHHLHANEMRLWSGDIHTHPGQLGKPSLRAGQGLGDLGYVEEVFALNESIEWFFIPILTGSDSDHITIHPWVCRRGDPLELFIADLKVCGVNEFPERQFNPAWEHGDGGDISKTDEHAVHGLLTDPVTFAYLLSETDPRVQVSPSELDAGTKLLDIRVRSMANGVPDRKLTLSYQRVGQRQSQTLEFGWSGQLGPAHAVLSALYELLTGTTSTGTKGI